MPAEESNALGGGQVTVGGPCSAKNTVFCPVCCGQAEKQPCLSPLDVRLVVAGDTRSVQPYAPRHFVYECLRCDYTEIHDHIVGSRDWLLQVAKGT